MSKKSEKRESGRLKSDMDFDALMRQVLRVKPDKPKKGSKRKK